MNNYALNIAAGNEFKVAVKIANTDSKLMQQEKIMQQDLANAQQSMQVACYHSAFEGAENAKTALDNEATGLDEAGTSSAVTSGLSIGSLTPHSFLTKATDRMGIKFGSDATHSELANLDKFDEAINKYNPTHEAGKAIVNNPNVPTGNTTIDTWFGHGREQPNLRGFDPEHDKTLINSLDKVQVAKLKAHVEARRNELNGKIHDHSEVKRSNFANASNNYGQAAGNLAQGIYKQDQAEDQKRSQIDSAENALYEQISSSIANFSQQTDQAAGNFSEAGLSILASLNTQG